MIPQLDEGVGHYATPLLWKAHFHASEDSVMPILRSRELLIAKDPVKLAMYNEDVV